MTAPTTPNAALARDLIVKFERIGRTGSTPEAALTVHVPANLADNADRVAEVLYLHVKRHLRSRDFEITVNLGTGEVFIEFGRFGKGRILAAEPIGPRPVDWDKPLEPVMGVPASGCDCSIDGGHGLSPWPDRSAPHAEDCPAFGPRPDGGEGGNADGEPS